MDIKVRDLKQTETIENDNKLMVLVDDDLNLVKNITKEEFLTNIISKTGNNALVQEKDGNLYVNTSEIADSVTELDNKLSNEIDNIETTIGDLDNLTTVNKSNLVSAINEAATKGSGGGSAQGGFNLFDLVQKDHILTFEETEGLERLGSYVYKTGVAGSRYGYPDFYNKCLEEYQNSSNTTETLNDITITVNANGHKFYNISDKSVIDAIYEETGIAWYYGIDEENERIFLPRNKYYFQNGEDVGNAIEAALPDILANSTAIAWANIATFTGAISDSTQYAAAWERGIGSGYYGTFDFKASNSNSIYKEGATVQPPSVTVAIYMVVGNTTVNKSQTEVTQVTTSENDTIPLFTGMYFDFKPNHVSWLACNTQASGSIYKSAYNTLVDCLNPVNNIYNLLVIEENQMQPDVDYSGYWKVNQEEMTFTTPEKMSWEPVLLTNTVPVIGNGMALGFNNLTGTILQSGNNGQGIPSPIVGAQKSAYGINVETEISVVDTNDYIKKSIGITNDPNYSGLIAQLSSLKNVNANLYFKVGNAVENLELINAGEVLEELNNKVNVDLSNIDKNLLISYGMPDYDNRIENVGNNYTAPCAGLYIFAIANTIAPANMARSVYINGVEYKNIFNNYGTTGGLPIMLDKGDVIYVASPTTALSNSYFIPMKGAK